MQRRTLKNYRTPDFLGPRVIDKVVMALVLMSVYWGVGSKLTSSNFINTAAVLYLWTALPAFGAGAFIPALFLERPLYIR